MSSYLEIGAYITVEFDKGKPVEVEWRITDNQLNGLSLENLRTLVEDRFVLCGFNVKVELPKRNTNGDLKAKVISND